MDAEGAPPARVRVPLKMWIEHRAARDGAASRQGSFPTVRVAVRRHHLFGERGRNESSGADLAFEIPLGQELCIGVQNRKTGNLGFGCQFPAGRNLLSGPQIAAEDRFTISVVNLLM